MIKKTSREFVLASCLLTQGCAIESAHYALVSTKESGAFPKSEKSTPFSMAQSSVAAQPNAPQSRPFDTIVQVRFTNESWYPLSKEEMTSAVKDSLLESLSGSGKFHFVRGTEVAANDQSVGYLDVDISLIESIETVKVTATLQVPAGATYVVSVNGTLKERSRKEIFDEFRRVGGQAGENVFRNLP